MARMSRSCSLKYYSREIYCIGTHRAFVKVLRPPLIFVVLLCGALMAAAHPLGNFTVNHFARIEVGAQQLHIRYVVDMAEIPSFQEGQQIDANGDGTLSDTELNTYLTAIAPRYGAGLNVEVDNVRLPLQLVGHALSRPPGAGGLLTLRVECDFASDVPATIRASEVHRLRFADLNHRERTGWREIVVGASAGDRIFNSTVFGSAVTDEIKAYPQDMLTAPLDERTVELSWTSAALPAGSVPLRTRDGRPAEQTRDRFAELISVRELTPLVALFGLLLATGLGALHAFSPGHGKTVVGAYLVGTRGTVKHAAFLGLTVTITHTAGVFALGLITLFAAQYIMPERLLPILSFVSGAIVLSIGLSLFVRRLRGSLGLPTHDHTHEHGHKHDHAQHTHTHGGVTHSHLPPGTDGSPVTWRNLLALGISGGLLPCPSALVVLLSAISFHRVGYGLALVVAFSVGLAGTLTAVGLAFVYAGRLMKRPLGGGRLVRVLPMLSALVIACAGAAICYEVLAASGMNLAWFGQHVFGQGNAGSPAAPRIASLGAFTLLGLGLVFGLKHATEVDHIIAVSTIVSEHRNVLRAALVGGLWGVGHTASLVVVGAVVLALRVAIPERVANWLEFGVALMIIWLGASALVRALRGRADMHVHHHSHDGAQHVHLHFHEHSTEHAAGTTPAHVHVLKRIGIKPLLVGAMHGLAGSAALTLLILTQIGSPALGLLYLAIFGFGSICGMLLMSGLVGLPFALSARRLTGLSNGLQTVAGVLSVAFGFWYAYHTGIASGLLGLVL